MKTNTLRWLGVSAAVAAALLCWYLLSVEPHPAPQPAGKGLTRATHVSGKPSASKPAPPVPKPGSPEFKTTLLARGQKWLDARERDAAGLVAVWYLTGEKALLDESAEKFPNDPRVCMAMLQWIKEDTASAMPWILRLLAAEPDNPEGLYQKAWAHLRLGLEDGNWTISTTAERAGAMEALGKAAVMSGRREDHLAARMQTVHVAALACGMSPVDAVRLALDAPLQHSTTTRALMAATNTLIAEWMDAKAAGSEERLMEVTGLALVTADKLCTTYPTPISDELCIYLLRTGVLNGLPDDTELGAGGRPVGALRAEIAERYKALQESERREAEASALLATAGDELMTRYFNRFMTHGEAGAQVMLLELAKEGK